MKRAFSLYVRQHPSDRSGVSAPVPDALAVLVEREKTAHRNPGTRSDRWSDAMEASGGGKEKQVTRVGDEPRRAESLLDRREIPRPPVGLLRWVRRVRWHRIREQLAPGVRLAQREEVAE